MLIEPVSKGSFNDLVVYCALAGLGKLVAYFQLVDGLVLRGGGA